MYGDIVVDLHNYDSFNAIDVIFGITGYTIFMVIDHKERFRRLILKDCMIKDIRIK